MCDLTGSWRVELPEAGPRPFSAEATLTRGEGGLCAEHPGGPVNARVNAALQDATLRVQWMSSPVEPAEPQTEPLVPVRGDPAPAPTCAVALPPTELSDGLLNPTADPWGYTCAVDPECSALECRFFRGADEADAGSFRMIR